MDLDIQLEFDCLNRQLEELRQQVLQYFEDAESNADALRRDYGILQASESLAVQVIIPDHFGTDDDIFPPVKGEEGQRLERPQQLVNDIRLLEEGADQFIVDIDIDEVSLHSQDSHDSGYAGSHDYDISDGISDVISEHSSFTERLHHGQRYHYELDAVMARETRPVIHVLPPVNPGPSKQEVVAEWLCKNVVNAVQPDKRCLKRKRQNDEDQDNCSRDSDFYDISKEIRPHPKKLRLGSYIRPSKSDNDVSVVRDPVPSMKRSRSDTCIF